MSFQPDVSPARWFLVVCLFAWTFAAAEEPGATARTADFRGSVAARDGSLAVGVEVFVYHLATAELATATTGPDGRYEFVGLPYGYYDLAVRAADGLYVGNEVAHVGHEGNPFLELRLSGPLRASESDLRPFAGANEAPIGLVIISDRRRDAPSFWRSPKGISTIVGGGALILILLDDGGDPPASPFVPAGSTP